MTVEVEVLPDAGALARAAAEAFVDAAARATAARGRFTVALAGGTTPRAAYALLAGPLRERVAWDAVHVWFGDERCVPPDDPGSNYAMARAALLDHVPVRAVQVHRVLGERAPAAAADAYDALLRAEFGAPGAPTFDLALLGVGDDGHTASLFPGDATLRVTDRWAVPAESPDPARPWSRVTLTLPALCGADEIVVLAAGASKRWIVQGIAQGEGVVTALPSARVLGRTRTRWLTDGAAA